MVSGHPSTRFVSFVAGLLVCGIASLPAARAQDAAPPAGYPPAPPVVDPNAPPVVDPNAPPPGAYPAPQPGGAPPAVQQSGAASYKPFLLIPFIGIQSLQNDNSGTGPGLRVGGLVGARLGEQFSFNGELAFDLWNISNVPAGASDSIYFIQFAAAPLFHVQASPTAEIVVGPKLGGFFEHVSLSEYTQSASGSAEGLLVGANLGAFFRLSDALSLGGLINFDYMKMEWCSNGSGDCTPDTNGFKVISFTGAAQF